VSLWAAALPGWVGLLAAGPLLLSAVGLLRRYALLSRPGSVVAVGRDGQGGWYLDLRGGERVEGTVLAEGPVHPWLTVVRLCPRPAGRRRVVPVAADMLSAEQHRRLRVALNLARP
jgi:hypothetical protein